MSTRLELDRSRILAHRRRVQALDARLPSGPESLRRAAWAGLTDSMPRAALLSLHARVRGIGPEALDDPALVQVWGPRYSAYAVAAVDMPVFTLGRLPLDGAARRRADDIAARVRAFLGDRETKQREVARGIGLSHPNALRYAAPTGTLLIRWDGAREPDVRLAPAPEMTEVDARLELLRRSLHVFGPGTATGFGEWAGIRPAAARATFEDLAAELTAVRGPIGEGWILSADEASFRRAADAAGGIRLLPSGDAFSLLHGAQRELLIPDAGRRAELWTSRVWPGALLVDGEIAGTWRRAGAVLTVDTWRSLSRAEREGVEAEAAALPLPGLASPVMVRWEA
jgi:hypothetical protein